MSCRHTSNAGGLDAALRQIYRSTAGMIQDANNHSLFAPCFHCRIQYVLGVFVGICFGYFFASISPNMGEGRHRWGNRPARETSSGPSLLSDADVANAALPVFMLLNMFLNVRIYLALARGQGPR